MTKINGKYRKFSQKSKYFGKIFDILYGIPPYAIFN